jgi:regulator of protease activity HflC (stomatin/prohibitin superfamily)
MLYLLAVILILIVSFIGSTVFAVKQQSVVIIERFGKFSKLKEPGLRVKAPFGIDRVAANIQLRQQQDEIQLETKTKDNVFVTMIVATQFRVNESGVISSYYKLSRPVNQIRSYIEDALRAAVPKLELDELFEKKDQIALDVQQTVAEEMSGYGYTIVKTLITSVDPDSEVKQAMNEINSAQRKRVAAQELANADKIKVVTAAEAEAEKDRLRGEGVANQRKAIVDGLASSIEELKDSGLSQDEVMSILLTNQWLDTMNDFAKNGNNVVFLPSGVSGAEDIRTQLLTALAAGSNPSVGKK